MTFARVKPTGWSRGETLTTAEINALDTNQANAVDKTGGTTITGSITWGSGSSAAWNNGSSVTQQAGSTWTLEGATSIPTGVTVTFAGGSTLNVAGSTDFAGTTTFSGAVTMSGTLTVSGAGKVKTSASGRIELGDNDYPTFSATRSRSVRIGITPALAYWASTYTDFTYDSSTPGMTSATLGAAFVVPLHGLHNGATLSTLDVYFTPRVTTTTPATPPSVQLYRRAITAGAAIGAQTALSGTATQSYTPGGDYNDGKALIMTYTCTTNNVIDTASYIYYLVVTDESGAGAVVGNRYHAVVCNYTAIADMRFQ